MARRPKLLEAKFEQVLLYADGPQIILLDAPGNSKIVAVAINHKEFELGFFAAQVSDEQFRDYLAQRFDLRYLLSFPDSKRNFVFDLSLCDDDLITVTRIKLDDDLAAAYLPEPGLFARDHTEAYRTPRRSGLATETFGIDGSWDLPEFSRFYGQYSDLYALVKAVDIHGSPSVTAVDKIRVRNAFTKPFRGGGSYVSLYDSLETTMPREDRLQVRTIQYNSPGVVRITGSASAFEEIKNLIKQMLADRPEIYSSYRKLNKFLQANKLLKYDVAKFDPKMQVAPEIEERAKQLAVALDLIDYNDLLAMSSQNVLLASKVLLSFYRRADRLIEFFFEGRASLNVPSGFQDGVSTSPAPS